MFGYLLATSLNAGPINFSSHLWQVLQTLLLISSIPFTKSGLSVTSALAVVLVSAAGSVVVAAVLFC